MKTALTGRALLAGRSCAPRPPAVLIAALCLLTTCAPSPDEAATQPMDINERLDDYTSFRLESDLSILSENERRMLPLLIEAAQMMDGLFWRQTYGDRDELLDRVDDPSLRRYIEINYGPWDRLAGDEPFVDGIGPKPPGARFYPADMTKEEFEAAIAASPESAESLKGLYTFVRRNG